MTVRERDERDAKTFAADALREAKRVMRTADTVPPGSYLMAVFTLLAVGAICPEVLAEPADADA